MKKRAWKTRLKKACVDVGTYKKQFDDTIDTLAGMLAARDAVWEDFEQSGEGFVIWATNKNGSTNKVKNPLIVIWDDLNKSALPLIRDLGLTPAGLRKINEEVFVKAKEEQNGNSLMNLLRSRQQAKDEE